MVGKEEIETMDVSEQESEKKEVTVIEREREGISRENGRCSRSYPSIREKAREESSERIKRLTQLHKARID